MPEFTITIDAAESWVDTGLDLKGSATVDIEVISGTWTANPENGMVDGNGHPDLIAKEGYSLPEAVEGLLVGRLGYSSPAFTFPVGSRCTIGPGLAGELHLSINDDINGLYGAGFTDNEGSLNVRIKIT
ncbi:MAG TPA: hypothetical protein VHQ64_02800 [Pyrinomonadaceae bacterium]|jgi:hypothetical protein|nr:hypothetical protein [Pyrinomonadaceae bacterium]